MIEIFAGALIGSSLTILALHFTRRLKPLPAASASYTGSSNFGAVGVDIGGNNNGPRLNIDPLVARKLTDVLPELRKWL